MAASPQALRGHTHEYKRHGTTTLFAALEVPKGIVHAGHYRRKRRREFPDFMNGIVAQYPDTELHVVLDNFVTHKPKHDRWLARHPQVHLHYTPTPPGSTRLRSGSASSPGPCSEA